jgi:hypothetical protein
MRSPIKSKKSPMKSKKSLTKSKKSPMKRKWSDKYKKSIDCKNPKGFSQRQYCMYGR